jgi:TPP-dependent indolepyruvate ferredoxin oxidoreductase alpha subunit
VLDQAHTPLGVLQQPLDKVFLVFPIMQEEDLRTTLMVLQVVLVVEEITQQMELPTQVVAEDQTSEQADLV